MGNMTTVSAARRACRHLKVNDPDSMDPGQKLELVDALNAALFTYFATTDDGYKRTTATELVLTPQTRTVTIANGATTITSGAFLDSERGKTVQLGDDGSLNEIVATDQVLRPHRGTGGSLEATIYSDAIAIRNFAVERIVNRPTVIDTNTLLTDINKIRDEEITTNPWYRSTRTRAFGDPIYYRVKYVGGSRATGTDDAVAILQLDPIPTRELTIEFDIDIRAVAYGISSLSVASAIPIDETVFAKQFLPLMEHELMASSLWAASELVNRLLDKRHEEALQSIGKLPAFFSRPTHRIKTPTGW